MHWKLTAVLTLAAATGCRDNHESPRATATAPSASASPGAGEEHHEPPFKSVPSLPSHAARSWEVAVMQGMGTEQNPGSGPRPDLSYVGIISSEESAGTIDVPESKWRCRFGPVSVNDEHGGVMLQRGMACSSDDWMTSVSGVNQATSAQYGGQVRTTSEEVALLGNGKWAVVALTSCDPSAPPTGTDGCNGSNTKREGDTITDPSGRSLRVHVLLGDQPQ